jgi:hypothetical protein
MCWNANVSINTYIFGLFACLFAFFNNKLSVMSILFAQSWMSIQLIEYFIWSKSFSNRLLSQIALLVILSQPLFGILSISNHTTFKYVALVGYLLFITVVMIFKPWSTIDFTTVQATNGHLSWKWLDYSKITILIWFLFLSIKLVVNKNLYILSLVTISAIVTYVLYSKTLTWGSLWCWLINIFSLILIATVFYDDICIYYKKK